jgi:hypothetical protein
MEQLDFLEQLDQTQSICPVCNKGFEKNDFKRIVCSKKCRNRKYRLNNKEKLKERRKQYYIDNKEELREKEKQKYFNNKEKIKERAKQYRLNNKEKVHKKIKQYRLINREKINEQAKQYRFINRERIIKWKKQYRLNNKEKLKQKAKQYYIDNKEELREKRKHYGKVRYHEDIKYRISRILRKRVYSVIKGQNTSKISKTKDLIGCDWNTFKPYFESKFREGMTWENHGRKGWHIDHIIPCASFDLTDPEQQKKCFHYTNLQPLWWYENLSKGDKILEEYTKDIV